VITANQKPDHSSISRFRKNNEQELSSLFTEVLKLCSKAGLLKVGLIALDGTKVKGNTALSSNRTSKHIETEVKKILKEAAIKDAEEDTLYGPDKRGDELPEELRDRRSRLVRLKECKERLDREASEKISRQASKIEARKKKELATGKKKRGRKPKMQEKLVSGFLILPICNGKRQILSGRSLPLNQQRMVTQLEFP